jgi:DNA mismatch endonuclease (patch repair protein)
MAFPSRKKAIFVHGCFWHSHEGCPNYRAPKSRPEFWLPKLRGNRERDARVKAELERQGWSVLVIWECETACQGRLEQRLKTFLEGASHECLC